VSPTLIGICDMDRGQEKESLSSVCSRRSARLPTPRLPFPADTPRPPRRPCRGRRRRSGPETTTTTSGMPALFETRDRRRAPWPGRGLLGRLLGWRLARKKRERSLWVQSLLELQPDSR
jgi:hypothetical protein